MKKLKLITCLIGFQILSSSLALADFERRNGDFNRRERSFERIDRRLLKNLDEAYLRAKTNLGNLRRDEKKEIIKLAKEIQNIADFGLQGDHGYPLPEPEPINPFTFSVNVGSDISFMIQGRTIDELSHSCRSAYNSSNYKDLISVTFLETGARASVRIAGYFTNVTQVCNSVTVLAIEAGFKAGRPISNANFVIYGIAENIGFYAESYDLMNLGVKCQESIGREHFSVDDLKVALNGKDYTGLTTSGYWKSAQDICAAAIPKAME